MTAPSGVVIARREFLEKCRAEPGFTEAAESGRVVVVSIDDLLAGHPVPDPPPIEGLPVGFTLICNLGFSLRLVDRQQDHSESTWAWLEFCDVVRRLARSRRFIVADATDALLR